MSDGIDSAVREKALAQLGLAVVGVAHEMRNGLAGVGGALQIIARRLPEDSKELSIVPRVLSKLDSLDRMVGNMLSFSRPPELKIESLSLQPLLQEICDSFRASPHRQGVELQLAGDECFIEADATRLETLFVNLLENAALAMNHSGNISIVVAASASAAQISVADDGPGVAPEIHARIFEPFFSGTEGHTGLGLAVATQVVEAHGGSIVARNGTAGGASFVVSLPVSPETSVAS
jgi:signal transduction histidine kinase